MQLVNDDMDELFRRAGEEYSLDTSGSDWEKVAGELASSGQTEAPAKKTNKKLLWLLLLLPFSLICNQYFVGGNVSKTAINNTEVDNNRDEATIDKPVSVKMEKPDVVNGLLKATNSDQLDKSNGAFKEIDNKVFKEVSNTTVQVLPEAISKTKSQHRLGTKAAETINGLNENSDADNSPSFTGNLFTGKKNYHQIERATKSYPLFLSSNKWPAHQNIASSIEKEEKSQKGKRDKKFYAGLVGGIDATSIKFQKVGNAGYDFGLLLGYSINKKWSIETGVLRDKKIYYSKGEYFNTSKIYLPPNSEVASVDGSCHMWEIPLNVRYDFKSTSRVTWFATAGLSSYLMKKEAYSYDYYYPMSGQSYPYSTSYDNGSRHFFSNLQFSAGYTHKLGKVGDIRIEPYIKVPLRGVGIGSMPLQSAGIHVGITRRLF
jgi:hypothetical protein